MATLDGGRPATAATDARLYQLIYWRSVRLRAIYDELSCATPERGRHEYFRSYFQNISPS